LYSNSLYNVEDYQLIYNKVDKIGKYKAVYFDTRDSHTNEGPYLKTIENGQMKLFKPSSEQIDQMYQIIRSGLNEVWRYNYKDFDNAEIDNTLLLSIIDDEADPETKDQGQRYYNWQNTTSPMIVVGLLRLFDKISHEE
jgi:hypothetical protein